MVVRIAPGETPVEAAARRCSDLSGREVSESHLAPSWANGKVLDYAAIKAVTLSEADVRAITAPSPGLAEVWRFYANEEKRER